MGEIKWQQRGGSLLPFTSPVPSLTSERERWICLISRSMTAFEVLNQFLRTYRSLLTDWRFWSPQPVQTSGRAIINEPSHIPDVSPLTIFKRSFSCWNPSMNSTPLSPKKLIKDFLKTCCIGPFCVSPHALLSEFMQGLDSSSAGILLCVMKDFRRENSLIIH